MNATQATRLLNLGFQYVGRYDAPGNRVAGWGRNAASVALHQFASDRAAWLARDRAVQTSQWGSTVEDQVARQITTDAITGLMAFLVPVPGGGFIIGTVEQWVFNETASALADKLEAAVKQEFGPQWAPWVAAGIGVGVLAIVAIAASKQSG